MHPFLVDEDVARLLRVGHLTALALLPGFTFHQHVFEGDSQQQMLRMRALYEVYNLRPTRMCLLEKLRSLSLEEGSGRSPFPSSLTSLVTGPRENSRLILPQRGTAFLLAPMAPLCEAIDCSWTQAGDVWSEEDCERLLMMQASEPVERFRSSHGLFNCQLPPGLLPHGLRCLQFSHGFNNDRSPFHPDFLPSTLEVLQVDWYNEELVVDGVSVLPSPLKHLDLMQYSLPLSPFTFPYLSNT